MGIPGVVSCVWQSNVMKTLPALLSSTNMLVCGEDLGMVPRCVPPSLEQLGIIGLRIQRMPGWEDPTAEFGNPATYGYLNVASPSCHDTTPLRAWWKDIGPKARKSFQRFLDSCDIPDAGFPFVRVEANGTQGR